MDDLLITSGSQQHAEAVITSLRDRYKELKVTNGKVHNYLGMVLDFSSPPCVTIRQNGMVEDIVTKAKSSIHIPTTKLSPKSPWTEQLFSSSPDSPPLSEAAMAEFHSYTAKWLFVGGHGRPDLLTPISYFTKRVLNPTEEDARKLPCFVSGEDSGYNARKAERVTIDGISGVLPTDKGGELRGICQVHIHTEAIASILSFSQLACSSPMKKGRAQRTTA